VCDSAAPICCSLADPIIPKSLHNHQITTQSLNHFAIPKLLASHTHKRKRTSARLDLLQCVFCNLCCSASSRSPNHGVGNTQTKHVTPPSVNESCRTYVRWRDLLYMWDKTHFIDITYFICVWVVSNPQMRHFTLQRIATHCSALPHTATRDMLVLFVRCAHQWWVTRKLGMSRLCIRFLGMWHITLQQTATHYNTLQHTATLGVRRLGTRLICMSHFANESQVPGNLLVIVFLGKYIYIYTYIHIFVCMYNIHT